MRGRQKEKIHWEIDTKMRKDGRDRKTGRKVTHSPKNVCKFPDILRMQPVFPENFPQ
jgi:hypothetical protein